MNTQERIDAVDSLNKAKKELVNLYDKCYSDNSCDQFDRHHDDILCQIDGIDETRYLVSTSKEDLSQWEIDSVNLMIKQLKSEWRRLSKSNDIEWVYG